MIAALSYDEVVTLLVLSIFVNVVAIVGYFDARR